MPNPQIIHTGDPAYASPVIRPPSPASSVGTAYGPDQTSQSDIELSKEDFEQKWLGKLNLDGLTIKEEDKSRPTLIDSHPPEGSPGEKELFEGILRGLRLRVQQLEADAVFQQLLMRGSQVGLERPPSDNNINTLMCSMIPTQTTHSNISDGPWNRRREEDNITLDNETTLMKGKDRV
ncbi:hypothetical protein V8B97DRAFT_198033 [Scleroderma yunnanense]